MNVLTLGDTAIHSNLRQVQPHVYSLNNVGAGATPAFDLFTQIKDLMLKHALQPSRNKCQHDEGEDSNAALSLPHCLADTSEEAGVMDVQHSLTHTHFYMSLPVCGGGERGNLFSQGEGAGQFNLKMCSG